MFELLSLHFTDKCTRECPNCYVRNTTKTARDQDFFLPFAEVAQELGIKQIALGGGEPTLFPDFVSHFSDLCHERGIILNMTTNGDGFNCENIGQFKGLSLISFSIDKYKVQNLKDLQDLFSKMCLAKEVGLEVGANLQLDPFIMNNLYEMLGELFEYCNRIFLLQHKPNNIFLNADVKTKLLTARLLYEHLYIDESLMLKLGMLETCGRGQRIISVDFAGEVSTCSFDRSFARLIEAHELIEIVEKYYPFPNTNQCPFL